jgi:hypothetical protein
MDTGLFSKEVSKSARTFQYGIFSEEGCHTKKDTGSKDIPDVVV